MRSFEGNMRFLGENPPVGATISYRLAAKADSARVVITDQGGATVRELKGDALKDKLAAGLNQVRWDLRAEPLPRAKKGAAPEGLMAFFGGSGAEGTPGPMVMPGQFQARLIVNGADVGAKSFEVRGDPAVEITAQDRRARQEALAELQRLQATLTDASDAARAADQQLKAVKKELSDTSKVPAPIRAAIDSVGTALDSVKKVFGIRDPNEPFDFDFGAFMKILPIRVAMTAGNIGGAMMPPTRTDLARIEAARRDTPAAVAETNAALDRLRGLFRRLADAGLYPPVPEAVKPR